MVNAFTHAAWTGDTCLLLVQDLVWIRLHGLYHRKVTSKQSAGPHGPVTHALASQAADWLCHTGWLGACTALAWQSCPVLTSPLRCFLLACMAVSEQSTRPNLLDGLKHLALAHASARKDSI